MTSLGAALDALPLTWSPPHEAARLALYRGTCDEPGAATRTFRHDEALWEAWWRDELALTDAVVVSRRLATVGRHLAASLLPRPVGDEARALPWTRERLQGWLHAVTRRSHAEVAARCSAALERLGDAWSARLGGSWCIDDLRAPSAKGALVEAAEAAIAKAEADYRECVITDGERYNKIIDHVNAAIDGAVGEAQRELIGTALEPYARASRYPSNWRSMSVTVGLVASTCGTIVERPVFRSLAQGLDTHDFMSLATARRNGELGARSKLCEVEAMFDDLDRALRAVRVVTDDCGAQEATARRLVACRARDGVCAACYGRDPDDGAAVAVGEAVGLRAAWAIASLMARLPGIWRTYGPIWGGSPTRRVSRYTTRAGVVLVEPELFVNGTAVRPGRIEVVDDEGECETIFVCEGDRLLVAHGASVTAHTAVAGFDPSVGRVYTAPLAAGRSARVSFEAPPGAIQPAGESRWAIAPTGPRWVVMTAVGGDHLALHLRVDGVVVRTVFVAVGSVLRVTDGDVVVGGDVLATEPLPKTEDEHFEDSFDRLRRTLDQVRPHAWGDRSPAVFAPFDGVVAESERDHRSAGCITVQGFRGETFSRKVRSRYATCFAGEVVLRGDVLSYGHKSLPRLLRYRGERHVIDALVGRFTRAAAEHGQPFAAVHAELLVRAMLDWRRVRRAGDSGLRRNAVVPRADFERACDAVRARGGEMPEGVTVIRGLGTLAGRRWKVSHRERMEARAVQRMEEERSEEA